MNAQHMRKNSDSHNGLGKSSELTTGANPQIQQSARRTLRTTKRGLPIRSALFLIVSSILMCGLTSTQVLAGHIILGGDDLDLHGSYSAGANQQGWLYIQKAIDSIYLANCVTRPNDGSIAALGCPLSTATATSGDAAGAIHHAATVALGKTVSFYEGAANIDAFFSALTASTVKPAIIYIPSS